MANALLLSQGAKTDQLLPYEADSPKEFRAFLLPGIERLRSAILNDGPIDDIVDSLSLISHCCNLMVQLPLEKSEMADVLVCLWELTFGRKPDRVLFNHALTTLTTWLRRIRMVLEPKDVELPWKPAYKTWKFLQWVPTRASIAPSQLIPYLELVVMWASRFFSADAPQAIMEEIRPYLCGSDMSLRYGCTTLYHFMPTHPKSRSAAREDFLEWRHEVTEVWDYARRHVSSKSPCMAILARVVKDGIGLVDLSALRPVIYKQVLRYLRLNPNEPPGREVNARTHLSEAVAFTWLCLPNDEEFWRYVEDVVHVLLPVLHPSNRGRHQQGAVRFLSVFLDSFCNRREQERVDKSSVPEHARLQQQDYDRVFHAFKDIILRCLNSKDMGVVQLGVGCSMHVCILAPRLFSAWVVENMHSGLQSFESHRLIATLLMLGQVPKFLFSPGFVSNGDKHLVPLIHALLPAVDVNDHVKTLEALNVVMELMQTVTFVDCSNHIPDDATPEEAQAMEATCQFESWLDAFLDTIFELVENMAGTTPPAGWRNLSFDVVLQGFFLQLGPSLANRAVDKVAQWVLTLSIESANYSIKGVTRSAALANPKRMLDQVLPPLTDKLLDLAAQEPSVEQEKEEVVSSMILLSSYLDVWQSIITLLDPVVLEHRERILAVFRAVMRLRGDKAVLQGSQALRTMLQRLTTPWLPDRYATTLLNKENIEADPASAYRRRFYSGMTQEEVDESIFRFGHVKSLLDGSLDPRWRMPSEGHLAFAEELVGAFYDDAVGVLERCAATTGKEAQQQDRDALRNALLIVEAIADTPAVVPFIGRGGKPAHGPVFGKAPPGPRHSVRPTSDKALGRHEQLVGAVTRMLRWLLEERSTEVKLTVDCLGLAQVLLVPEYRSRSSIGERSALVADHITPLGRPHLMGLLDDIERARYDMHVLVAPLHDHDMPLLQGVLQCLRSRFPDVRADAAQVLGLAGDVGMGVHARHIYNMVLDMWEAACDEPLDDARHTVFGCLNTLLQESLATEPTRDMKLLARMWHVLRLSTRFEDQQLYDALNEFVTNQLRLFSRYSWPGSPTEFARRAAAKLPTQSPQEPAEQDTGAGVMDTGADDEQGDGGGTGSGDKDKAVAATTAEGTASASSSSSSKPASATQTITEWRVEQVRTCQELMLFALETLKTPGLTWKHQYWFIALMSSLVRFRETVHPTVVRYLFANMASGVPIVRQECMAAINVVLRVLKTPVALIDVRVTEEGTVEVVTPPYQWLRRYSITQPWAARPSRHMRTLGELCADDSCGSDSNGGVGDDGGGSGDNAGAANRGAYVHKHFGYRRDTRVVCPEIDEATAQYKDIGEDEVYLDKPFWGWYAWPKTITTYAPEKYQCFDHLMGHHDPPTDPVPDSPGPRAAGGGDDDAGAVARRLSDVAGGSGAVPCMDVQEMMARSRAAMEVVLQDVGFLHKLLAYIKEDTRCPAMTLTHLFKGLFRNYGYALVPQVLPEIASLCKSTLPPDHRVCTALLQGLLRGSKHWPRQDKQRLWADLVPLFEATWLTLPSSVLGMWCAFITRSVCELDPRRSAWLVNLLLRKHLEPDPTRTALQRHVLGVLLSAALAEFAWRGRHISALVLRRTANDLGHAYDLVRQTAAALVSCGYAALIPQCNALATTQGSQDGAAKHTNKAEKKAKKGDMALTLGSGSSAEDAADSEGGGSGEEEQHDMLPAFTAELVAPLREAIEETPPTPIEPTSSGTAMETGASGSGLGSGSRPQQKSGKRSSPSDVCAEDFEGNGGGSNGRGQEAGTRGPAGGNGEGGLALKRPALEGRRRRSHAGDDPDVAMDMGMDEGARGTLRAPAEGLPGQPSAQANELQQQTAMLQQMIQQIMLSQQQQPGGGGDDGQGGESIGAGTGGPQVMVAGPDGQPVALPPDQMVEILQQQVQQLQHMQGQQQGASSVLGMGAAEGKEAEGQEGEEEDEDDDEAGGLPKKYKWRLKGLCSLLSAAQRHAAMEDVYLYFLQHVEVFLDLLERVSDKDISGAVKATLTRMVRIGTLETGRRLCAYLHAGGCAWHTKTLVLPMLTQVVRNTFPQLDPCVTETTIAQLEDPQAEVQQVASKTLTKLARLGVLRTIPDMLAEFIRRANTHVRRVKRRPVVAGAKLGPEHEPLSAEEKAQLRRKHSGVLGIAALVLAHPYDMPEWMPKALVQLAAHTTDVSPIRSTANDALSQFWKTHKEAWHEMKNQLTAEEQEKLADVLISPSYYA